LSLKDATRTDQSKRARAENVQDLVFHPGHEIMVAELEARRAALERKILDGIDDYVTYRQYCARLEMVNELLELPQKIIAQAPKEGSPDE